MCFCIVSTAGSTLIIVGEYQVRLGGAEREFLQTSAANFLTPLRSFLEGDWRTISVSHSDPLFNTFIHANSFACDPTWAHWAVGWIKNLVLQGVLFAGDPPVSNCFLHILCRKSVGSWKTDVWTWTSAKHVWRRPSKQRPRQLWVSACFCCYCSIWVTLWPTWSSWSDACVTWWISVALF